MVTDVPIIFSNYLGSAGSVERCEPFVVLDVDSAAAHRDQQLHDLRVAPEGRGVERRPLVIVHVVDVSAFVALLQESAHLSAVPGEDGADQRRLQGQHLQNHFQYC